MAKATIRTHTTTLLELDEREHRALLKFLEDNLESKSTTVLDRIRQQLVSPQYEAKDASTTN